jgi:hypothetical protein
VAELAFPPRKTDAVLWFGRSDMSVFRRTLVLFGRAKALVLPVCQSASKEPKLAPPVAPPAAPRDADDHGRAEARRSMGSLREGWAAGGRPKDMPFASAARLTAGSQHTGAPSARSPAGHQLEMAVQWKVSGLRAISEPHKWFRLVIRGGKMADFPVANSAI